MVLRAIIQAATIVLLARTLGAPDYGEFVAVVAVAGLATPLAGLGLSNIVLRNSARDPAHIHTYLSRAATVWGYSLLPISGAISVVALLLLPAGLPKLVVFAAIVSEMSAASLTELAGRHLQAQHRISAYGAMNAGLPLVRILAIGLMASCLQPFETAEALGVYAAANFTYLLMICSAMLSRLPPVSEGAEPMPATSGLPFSLSGLAMRLQGEFNKPVLAHAGAGLAGTYNIAQRSVEMASLPLLALQEALWPRLYAHDDPLRQIRLTGLVLLGLAAGLGAVTWITAPLLPRIVGPSYENSVEILRVLACLPLLQVGRNLLNFLAIQNGRTEQIGWAYAIGAAVSVYAVATLVPQHGLIGAAVASYIAEAAMIAVLIGIALRDPR